MKVIENNQETQITNGGIRDFFALFFPALLMSFSCYFAIFIEKILLGRFSTEALQIAVSTNYACMIFQAPCKSLAMMSQVFVGRWYGANQRLKIGWGIWQFIWFSLLSMFVMVPLGMLYGKFYFHGTPIEQCGLPYFYSLLFINFLFPLGVTLSSFYLGQGKTKLILLASFVCQTIKVVLAYLLIFNGFGLMGGLISTAISQGAFCIFLLSCFLHSKNNALYKTRNWSFNPKLFWHCIKPGFMRSICCILNFGSWSAISYVMTARGGDCLLYLSIGGALFIVLPFFSDAICMSQTTIVSQLIGAKKYLSLKSAFRSGLILVSLIIAITSIPLLVYPIAVFHFLFPKIVLDPSIVRTLFLGVWLSFVFFVSGSVPIGYILAFKDMNFSVGMGLFNWINGFLLIYVTIQILQAQAISFWFILSVMHLTTAILYGIRMRKNISLISIQQPI
ncbi:MAG: MATE family efflux transporter [Chlamydiales bacterium]